ncbi:MAG: hypothetical protein LKM41_04245 [Lachnospiraceae bacterium]|jgi:hypothetical protein|nr:hypothetical protein [Lachnospiraceae bacterium]
MKMKAAKIIRVITVPPVMAGSLILILALCRKGMFRGAGDIVLAVLSLMIIPVLAYPLQNVIPGFKGKGRDGQRKLAFIFTLFGYLAGAVIGYLTHVTADLQFVLNAYLLSVLILIFFNKVLHIRASGHGCSVTGPLVLLIYFIGPVVILPCIVVACAVVWSSVLLKRHKPSDLAFGGLSVIIGCAILLLIGLLIR